MSTRFIFNTVPELGLNINDSKPANEFSNGYTVETNAGGPVMWVRAAAALAEGQLCFLTTNVTTGAVTAALATTALLGSTLQKVGIVSKAIPSGEYGWLFVGPFDNVEVLTTTGIALGAQMTSHTVAGTVSTGGTAIPGLSGIEISVAGLTQCRATQNLRTT